MDQSDVLLNIGFLVLGAGIGLGTSALLNEQAKFRSAIDDACKVIFDLHGFPHECSHPLDMQVEVIVRFRSVVFRFTMLEQTHAKRYVDAIVNEVGLRITPLHAEIAALAENDPQVVSFEGDRFRMLQCRLDNYCHDHHIQWIDTLRDMEPDWDALGRCALRNLGMFRSSNRPHRVV